MSFLNTAFSGASNNFTPNRAYAPGTQATTQNFQPQISQANQNYGQVNQGFNALADALRQQMSGQGPNLANAQLQSATAQNVGNQAALAAGQRGASSNVGLMSRQIANQGANIQQQAAGQSAENVLAQQLSAQGQLGNVLGTQGGLANQNLGIQQNAQAEQNRGIVGETQNYNQIANQQAQQNAQFNQGIIGGIAGAGGTILGNVGGSAFKGLGQSAPSKFAKGGEVFNQWAQHLASGGLPFSPHDYRGGGVVKASNSQERATVKGNSLKNDKIPAMVSEGEVVLPREVTQAANAPQAAANFMAQVMAGKHRVKK